MTAALFSNDRFMILYRRVLNISAATSLDPEVLAVIISILYKLGGASRELAIGMISLSTAQAQGHPATKSQIFSVLVLLSTTSTPLVGATSTILRSLLLHSD
jgi:hypothetical protein